MVIVMKTLFEIIVLLVLISMFTSHNDSPTTSNTDEPFSDKSFSKVNQSVIQAVKLTPTVDDKSAIKSVVNEFMVAYVNRDRQGMEHCSFYEERQFTKDTGFEMLDKQMEIWDGILEILRQSGQRIRYDWDILSLRKIDNDNYEVDIALIMGSDMLRYPSVGVSRVGSYWLVDAESFVISASLSISNVVMNY